VAGLSPLDPIAVAAQVGRTFELLGVRYVIGGSLASTTFGEPRTTFDVDVAADLSPTNIDAALDAFEGYFLVDRDWAREEAARRGAFQLVHAETIIRIDVFVPEWKGFDLWKWENRKRVVVESSAPDGIDMTSPEAIILQKLIWYRSGDEVSDRQWRDVLGVLKAQHAHLDEDALEEWGETMGIGDLLAKALREAGQP
jgi:hypothetical protein